MHKNELWCGETTLCAITHCILMSIYIYIFTKVPQCTEPYRSVCFKIHNATVCVLPGLGKRKKGLDTATKIATEH